MPHSLAAAHYADAAVQRQVTIEQNQPLAHATWKVRLRCPEIAQRILPGQFLMLRGGQGVDPLLARPLAMYDAVDNEDGQPTWVDVVYLVVGKFTAHLARMNPGQTLEVWGPLGNGFPAFDCDHLILIAGGIGQTPFLSVAKEHRALRTFGSPPRAVKPVPRITFCYGVQRAELLAGVEDFATTGIDLQLATDDGSRGHHGLVTDLLRKLLDQGRQQPIAADRRERAPLMIACCGPEPMMQAASELAAQYARPCWVSLETPMACGVGICFTCVARIRAGRDQPWDYKRTCVDGPVFRSEQIEWPSD